jgi:carnitine 3-dehydrogenase
MNPKIKTVAVAGCGTIGASWAALFAAHEMDVRLYDISAEALKAGRRKALIALEGLSLDADELGYAQKRIRAVELPDEAFAGADFVQESVIERYEIKRDAHDLIERFAPSTAIIASSTSGLLAHRMQEGLKHPERFVIAHPFNPPHLIPLVELVPGPRTSEDVLRVTHDFYTLLGKIPIVVRKEVLGHVANRLAAAVWREAMDLVGNGVASLEDVDKAIYAGPGIRWATTGQHLIYHMNGGPGGYAGFMEHFSPQIQIWLEDMAKWTAVPDQARREVLQQMQAHVAGRTLEELEAVRDERLKKVLAALYPQEQVANPD